ncbi:MULTISPECIES: bifunctional acyl-ACP--phospholipid O-acyltransferase/long-chain-fatty-acid--ACP ligase [unclassified Uliginosibacterium]|uniref:bifunctional acyl-ACP--phospholipid O-acyltransferase/long-chain-fatty-acid--ACP ligase n=1 Tax=unclassified Uliginosibacterium TaxID=2621521 RepID=UPI00156DC099|nr:MULTISPECIES: bifunctional acyl-ACP--phospholipid O-acyltransferase/long-chain-fatty-acid--ACP ligase [unclassified Uliginosibacterium]MDO6387292.1 bifunctional acyl-ACP--phospholipid O-acyltransferase/long-chain-fatty-acid--ACP ligase [Uliginosibacterium sp. 31-12]
MTLGKRIGITMLRAIARVLFRIEVRGNPRVSSSKLLIIANHESFLDGLLLGITLPQRPLFVVHTGVARTLFFRLLLKTVDHLAVDPTSPMAMKTVIRVIDSGRPVVIFPEGRITTTGSLMKTYDGPAFVAAKTGATILPVRIDGAARTYFSRLSGKHPHQLFPRITISIQPTTRIEWPSEGSSRERRRKAGEAMRRLMQEMIFASRPNQTLFEAMLSAISIHGRSWRLVEDIKQIEYSYGDLLKMTLALGRLVGRKCAEGERVGVLLPNLAPTLGLILGLSAFRRVPALMNYTSGAEGMLAACEAATIRRIVTSRGFIEQAKLEDKISVLEQHYELIYLEDLKAEMTAWDKAWLILWALRFPALAAPGGNAEDPAVVLFTSGSEGKPKGVVLSHRAILANIQQARAVVDFSSEDKLLNALPLFHSFGLTVGGLLPVISGASVFLYTSPLHYRVIPELVYDRNCTILLGTSTFLSNYAKHAHPYDFYRLRYVIAGAEKLTQTVRTNWFEKFGIRILEGYGATECAPVLAVNTRMAYRTGSVGQLLPGMQARLMPVPGVELGGALHVSGPNLMSGYLRADNPGVLEPPSSELGSGWYNTGDIVDIDADGYLFIVGRLKRFAKVAGEMISLEVVERLALQASDKGVHAATSQPDAARGENILLYTTDKMLTRDLIQAAARSAGSPEIAVPRKIVVVDELPVLGSGKTDYVTLKQWAETA